MIFLLLTYSVQSLGAVSVGIDLSVTENHQNNNCHQITSLITPKMAPDLQVESKSDSHKDGLLNVLEGLGSKDCCEEGCSMDSCHTVSVLLSGFNTARLPIPTAFHSSPYILSLSKLPNSLYRPPILG
ncbi:MAG: hypothetical protein ACI93R_003468 [Flavobacteriales bacterium]|jgi:hypothetical protein